MANPYINQSAQLMPDQIEQTQIMRNRKLAEALQQQGMESPQGQMVSGIYVAPSITQYLAQGLKSYLGAKGISEADKKEKELADALKAKQENLSKQLLQGITPQETTQDVSYEDAGGVPGATQTVKIQPNYTNAIAQYLAGGGANDALVNLAMNEGNFNRNRAAQLEDRAANWSHEDVIANRQHGWQTEAQKAQFEQAQNMQKANQEFQRILQKESQGFQLTQQERNFAQQFQMQKQNQAFQAGQNALNRTAQQAREVARVQAENKTSEARSQLSDAVGQLKAQYDKLKEGGGIPSRDAGTLANINARLGSSGIGQALGGAIGTENQIARQSIEQTRPLLLNLIKNATGMSAQQMNSNVEMQMYLKAATDPTLSYEANMNALQNLDKMFGLGLNKFDSVEPPKGQNAKAGVIKYDKNGNRIQ